MVITILKMVPRHNAVSYTHLDVYKRQVNDSRQLANNHNNYRGNNTPNYQGNQQGNNTRRVNNQNGNANGYNRNNGYRGNNPRNAQNNHSHPGNGNNQNHGYRPHVNYVQHQNQGSPRRYYPRPQTTNMSDNRTQSNDHHQRENDNRCSQRNNSIEYSRSGSGDQRRDLPSGNNHRN